MPDKITPDDFPEGFRDVVAAVGIDAALVLCDKFGGSSIYVPASKTAGRRLRNLRIKEDFKAMSIPQLCRKYNLTESQIRAIVNMKILTIEDYLMED